jgi:signal transduction histidine kinase
MSRATARQAPGRPLRSARALYVAFGAVSVAFVLSTAISEYADVRIQRAAAQITGTTAPAVAALATLRGEIRWYTLLADDAADKGRDGVPAAPSPELAHARAAIAAAWTEYRSLDVERDEQRVAAETAGVKAELDTAIERFEGQMARGAWTEARATLGAALRPATERLDELLLRLVERHTERGAELAHRIGRLGHQSIALAIGLDATSLLLAVLTALLVVRVVRRYTALIERRAEELELFAGRVAHDVLGPLGAASLALDVAAADAAPGGRTARLVGSGRAGLRRARTIADALLEFARAGAQPTPGERADVAEVVRAVVDEVEPEAKLRGVALAVELAPGLAVACGAGMLTSIVSNLLRNAVKYVGDGAGKRVTVRARAAGMFVRLEVEDDGPGLPPRLGANVFQPYVRGASTGKPGIGLGLATVKKVTEAHGGRVDVSSTPGRGCLFEVALPVALPSLSAPESSAVHERSRTPREGAGKAVADREGEGVRKEGVDPPPQGP